MLDEDSLKFTERYLTPAYVLRAHERYSRVKNRFSKVLQEGRLPEQGFSESEIETFFLQLGSMDSNNWESGVGVGEREGRILLDFIHRRHYGLAHGIGRSGDITAIQPKAPGSSLVNKLTNQLLLDWLKKSGSPTTSNCFLVPMATGMTLTLCLLSLKRRRPAGARFVLWPRIDQKSCFKCILAAGLVPVPIDLRVGTTDAKRSKECEHQLSCDLDQLRLACIKPAAFLRERWPEAADDQGVTQEDAKRCGPDSIVCILSTTLCFSPRIPDRIHAITKICMEYGVSHLINNAYGVQSRRCMRMIEAVGKLLLQHTCVEQRQISPHPIVTPKIPGDELAIDLLYVQSTDKNLMVPVGGAIIAGFSKPLVDFVAKSYPGRASGTPSLDVLATLLHLGVRGWTELIDRREVCFKKLLSGLEELAGRHCLQVLGTADNPISLALDLNGLCSEPGREPDPDNLRKVTQLGAHLFTQGCSGVRVVLPASVQQVQQLGAYSFPGFGSHSSSSTVAYLNAAAAVGQTESEVGLFLSKLDKALKQFRLNNQVTSAEDTSP
ncbi:O-phospho-L-seryl-tRNASec:L-selenocysteinyl-tRNA synthase [Clonorchis sinensis]|uniref:O-phosphoseryl-tRNA(Sec) selenium transferase n=1 Tax=Clonorchis sinensis TaxID=79923 RepID=H2KV60_CLOSI|nr:O-phospho-L-seryl-tRNASec:L-selenocysteinyl-tRNA synthase [Clonorchis sinensis]